MICQTCPTKLGPRNQTGLCRICVNKRPVSEETRAKMGAATRRRLQADPELLERYRENARKASHSPAAAKARKERWERDKPYIVGNIAAQSPEARRKAAATTRATRLAWCPPHLRDEYMRLVRSKRLKAAEAREIILAQDAYEIEQVRRRMGYVEPAPEEVIPGLPKGRPQIWPDCPAHLRNEYARLRKKGLRATEARAALEKRA